MGLFFNLMSEQIRKPYILKVHCDVAASSHTHAQVHKAAKNDGNTGSCCCSQLFDDYMALWSQLSTTVAHCDALH